MCSVSGRRWLRRVPHDNPTGVSVYLAPVGTDVTTGESLRNDERGLDPKVETWWADVLNGLSPGRHPLQPRIQATLEDETLTVSGAVGSETELEEVERAARRYCGDAIPHIAFDVRIEPQSDGRHGLLRQVLWASFENCDQATIAADLLRERLSDAISDVAVLERTSDVEASRIPPSYAEDVEACLNDGRAVLVIEADETDTFFVQEVLDQDTRSLQTTVIPPVVAASDGSDSRAR